MSATAWRDGNKVELLENGEEFFPRVFSAIANARQEVLIETFILFDDKIGRELQTALILAARRGARVELTVDGYGTANLPPDFIAALTEAGVRLHVFDPQPLLFGLRMNVFRRMHRKLILIDDRVAFVGGINFSLDHVREFGPESKQDYAVQVEGPVLRDIRGSMLAQLARPLEPLPRPWWRWHARALPAPPEEPLQKVGPVRTRFVERNNAQNKDDIERAYREALSGARQEVIIVNAYFLPGFQLLRSLRNAARRGVAVRLVLQGHPDQPLVRWAGATLYDYLLQAGVKIYEYCERPLHGKVAVVDDDWATVGSSNLDPLSLFLNLEANLLIRDQAFARGLRQRLETLIEQNCEAIERRQARPRLWRQAASYAVFHLLRRFPDWAGLLPAHTPKRRILAPESAAGAGGAEGNAAQFLRPRAGGRAAGG